MRVVFCWEMGGNYGHITGFLPIYHELVRQGVEVFCILRERRFSYLLGEQMQAHCIQAPSPKCKAENKPLYSYADILAYVGYLNEPVLTRYIADWCELVKEARPDYVIVDHAPTALLAARVLGISTASIGTGFTNPPANKNFPLFFPERPPPQGYIDEKIVNVVNRALKNLNAPPLSTLSDIFLNTKVFLNTFAELDHYGSREMAYYWGPLYSPNIGTKIQWPTQTDPKIFAYLTPKLPNLLLVLKEIAKLPGYKILHVPGVDAKTLFDSQPLDTHIQTAPLHTGELFETVDLVINHGGVGLSSQCFIRGISQVIIPTQIEQRMLARQMLLQNIAMAIDPQKQNAEYKTVFHAALDPSRQKKINHPGYWYYSPEQQAEKIVREILEC